MADDRGNVTDNSTDQNAQPAPLTGDASPSATPPLGASPAPDYSESSAQGQSGYFQGNPNAAPAPTAAPGAQPPSMWRNILMGALVGAAGGAGAKTFSAGFGGGARMSLEQAQQQKDNAVRDQQVKMQQEQHESTIKFQSAQAASLAADTAVKDAHLHNLPQEIQDTNNLRAVQQLEVMKNLGLTPTLVAANTHGGAEVKAGLQQLTDSHGGVPPLFTINLGDKIVGFDLNQLTKAPQALDQVNKIRQMQGQGPIDPQTWSSLPDKAKIEQTNNAFGFWMPAASEATLMQYQNTLATVKAQPDSPDKADNVAKLQTLVDSMKSTLDAVQQRSTQQYKNETPAIAGRAAATEYAKKAAENKADNENDAETNKNAGLTGDAYFQTLPAADQGTVKAVMEGRTELTPRVMQSKEGLKIARMVNQVDPGFDMSRAPAYFAARKGFTSGKESKGINHLNTAIQHLGKLYEATTATATLPGVSGVARAMGGTNAKAFEYYKTKVGEEIAEAYRNGALTDMDKKDADKQFNEWLPGNAREGEKALTTLLVGKLHAYDQQWQNAKPSAAVADFPVISQPNVAIIKRITGEDVTSLTTQASRTTQPVSHTGTVPVGAQPIMRNGQTVGFVQNGQRTDF